MYDVHVTAREGERLMCAPTKGGCSAVAGQLLFDYKKRKEHLDVTVTVHGCTSKREIVNKRKSVKIRGWLHIFSINSSDVIDCCEKKTVTLRLRFSSSARSHSSFTSLAIELLI